MEVRYKTVRYTWLSAEAGKSLAGDGWGIKDTADPDPVFCQQCRELMSGVNVPSDGSLCVRFLYAGAFRSHVYIAARRIPALPQMGGGDNNKLVTLYIPDCTDPCQMLMCPPDFYEEGSNLLVSYAEEAYGYADRLNAYGIGLNAGESGQKRLAVLLSYLYLSFMSDAWKQLFLFAPNGNSIKQSIEITWILMNCIPDRIFGRDKASLQQQLCFVAGNLTPEAGVNYLQQAPEVGDSRHTFFFEKDYDPQQQLTRQYMDRKVDQSSGLFMKLAETLQESPEAGRAFVQELLSFDSKDVDSIGELSALYEQAYIPAKLYNGLSKELYECSCLEGLHQYSKLKDMDIFEGIRRYQECQLQSPAELFLTGGVELLTLLYDAAADAKLARRVLDEYEDPDRFIKHMPKVSDPERAMIHDILKGVREAWFSLAGEAEKVDCEPEKVERAAEKAEAELVKAEGKVEKEEGPIISNRLETANRVDEVLKKKKKGVLASLFEKA